MEGPGLVSLAALAPVALCGRAPFGLVVCTPVVRAQIYRKVTQRSKPASLEKIVDEQTREFIDLCLEHDYQKRPSATELLNHAYLSLPFGGQGSEDDVPVELRPREAKEEGGKAKEAPPKPAAQPTQPIPQPAPQPNQQGADAEGEQPSIDDNDQDQQPKRDSRQQRGRRNGADEEAGEQGDKDGGKKENDAAAKDEESKDAAEEEKKPRRRRAPRRSAKKDEDSDADAPAAAAAE